MFVIAVKYSTIAEPSIWFEKDGWDAFKTFMWYAKLGYGVSVRHTNDTTVAAFSEEKGLTLRAF